ncbi:hypothetical protein [Streptomyces tauricus]
MRAPVPRFGVPFHFATPNAPDDEAPSAARSPSVMASGSAWGGRWDP